MMEGIYNRYLYYEYTDGYLKDLDNFHYMDILSKITIANVLVLLIFYYGRLVTIFKSKQLIVLSLLYILSIYLPLFFRLYIFYFFIMMCESNIVNFEKRNISQIIFIISLIVILINFAFKTNVEKIFFIL